jgi:D-aminopeptidase
LALGRLGSISSNSSGDISIAFSTVGRVSLSGGSFSASTEVTNAEALNQLFRATVEGTEEAILNSIFTSETMKGRDDNISPGLPIDETVEIMRRHGRL